MFGVSSLEVEEMKSYRPVSNLPYISKIVEKTALKQISAHMVENDLMEPCQSAYRAHHSIETALLRIMNHLSMSVYE